MSTLIDPIVVPLPLATSAKPGAGTAQVSSRWPCFEQDEIDAVVEVLKSGRVNALQHGDNCRAFEQAFAAMCDMPHAISLANGSLALELALRALGIGPGDEVIVTPRSFVASASCVAFVGGIPVFADVDPESQNLTAASIAQVLTPRTKAIVVVHLAGWPCEMDEIVALADRHGLKVIEDCAQAHGATFKGRPIGSFGDASAFSFCTDKIISTGGEGGMLLLRDEKAWKLAWSYKDHGKDRDLVTSPVAGNGYRWLHTSFGTNFRLTEMQAAIGLRQLGKLPRWVAARRRNAALLNQMLADVPGLRRPIPPADIGHAYYKYYAFIRPNHLRQGWDRERIVNEVNAAGVPCFTGACPEIYRELAFAATGLGPKMPLPNARWLGENSIMLQTDHTLDHKAIRIMANTVKAVLMTASI